MRQHTILEKGVSASKSEKLTEDRRLEGGQKLRGRLLISLPAAGSLAAAASLLVTSDLARQDLARSSLRPSSHKEVMAMLLATTKVRSSRPW